MDDTSAILVAALLGGMLASGVRLPPLVGFLAAGFALHPLGVEAGPALETVADLGVTVLLFGIGLKIDVRTLARREVWLTSAVHMVGTTGLAALGLAGLGALGVGLAAEGGARTWLLVGFALSFSSTVFVVKMLEARSATRSLGGRTAIGVLVVQDIAAVVFLAVGEGQVPSPWAVTLVLLVPLAWPLRRLVESLGHGELLPLMGIVLALVPGYALFDAVGVKGDLGALVLGMLLAGSPRSGELAKSLFTIKDLLLVGFFVSIGLQGFPTPGELTVALTLLVLLPLKALGFALLLWTARLRRRTSVLTGVSLGNFSEFGLIVLAGAPAGLLADGWLTVLATSVALSFVAGSVPIRQTDHLSRLLGRLLPDRPRHRVHPEDRPLDLGGAEALVLGMGRVGRAAYGRLAEGYGLRVLGLETSQERCERLRRLGVEVVEGDATDPDLWAGLSVSGLRLVLLAMPFHGNNLAALTRLRENGFEGTAAVVAQYDDDLRQATEAGADTGFQLYDGAGAELADRAARAAGAPPTQQR